MGDVQPRTMRRLAAILAADVVGYSRMMGADEAGTLARLKRHREQLFDPAIAARQGRIVKLIGDGTLVEFLSVVDAVECAVAIQEAIRADGNGDGKAIALRIGVNLGDVIVEDDDIYGDGVNVAARLEGFAETGGICVSAIVKESVGSRAGIRFRDGGEVSAKNIDHPIRIWRWHPADAAKGDEPAAAAAAAPRPPQSIAVLPFTNLSNDPEQEYFSDGITEDIITDLSKVAGLTVIARNSSFQYKGKSTDIRIVGRDLGVRSVLEGSIRRAGNRVRINAQLIDATSGGHLWAERFDRDLTDIFAVQDEVTRRIVDALQVTLTPAEAAMVGVSPTGNLEAHDLVLKARALFTTRSITKPIVIEAQSMLERAIELDPNYSEAYAFLALTHVAGFNNSWTDSPPQTLDLADELANKAVALAPNSGFAYSILATVAGFKKDVPRSTAASNKALELLPNDADAWLSHGAIKLFGGNPTDSIPDFEKARRLDPANTDQAVHFLGLAHLLLRNFETAVTYFRERIRLSPQTDFSRMMLASALGHLGRTDEARAAWAELRKVNPDYAFELHRSRMPFRTPAEGNLIAEGLEKAGLLGN